MGIGSSEFKTVIMDGAYLHISRASDPFLQCKMHYIFLHWSWYSKFDNL